MEVKVYSTPTCPYSKKAKEYLSSKRISYQDIDVSSSKVTANEMKKKLAIILFLFFSFFSSSYAEEIYLKNGDRISGQIVNESDKALLIKTEAMGEVSVDKGFLAVEKVEEKTSTAEEKLWSGEFSLGYNRSGGNTQSSQMANSLYANRKTDHDEFTVKGNNHYSSSSKKMDAQSWRGMLRYAFSFGEKEWYNFYKLEGDHDKFAAVDYRLLSSVGVGYWFSDTEDWKAMLEAGLGLEHTSYNDGTDDNNEAVLVPRAFFEKKIFNSAMISQDVTLYPSLDDTGEFRLRSETALTSPINDKMSLRFSFIDDYDSLPAENSKKNDTKIISALVYSF